ncbi:MAG: EscU/YscU/HrcU family type III secretion system export apparatus switch protein [Planctomycetaceae bacterium]|nr:EscU/YscU/HrcU family type III secretion system export apparatus switch protein [Planctomycetaceae bacterium]
MSEDATSRTEMPTPLRLQEARRRGEVARSADFSGAIVVFGSLMLLMALAGSLTNAMREMFSASLDAAGKSAPSATGAFEIAGLGSVLWLGGALCLAAALLAIGAGLGQVGPLMTGEPVKFDLSRVGLMKGLKGLFGRRVWVRVGLGLAKVTAAGAIAWAALSPLGIMTALPTSGGSEEIAAWGGGAVLKVAIRASAALLALAVVDLFYQRWQFRQDLKMTRREYLDDMRKMEGDPQIRLARRREMSKRRGRASLRKPTEGSDG